MTPPILSNERLISDIVLIVDDIPENLALLHDALDEAGHTVLVATNGESALQRARQSLPDVILLDALMPGMDGFEVARRLKADFATQHIPIVFMTGLTETEHVVAAFAAGGKGGHHVLGFGQPGHEDDGDVLGRKVGLEPAGHLEAVHAGHQRVEQDDVGQALAGPLQRRFAVGGNQHGVAGFIKGIVEQREVFRDVVDDQDDVRNQAFI